MASTFSLDVLTASDHAAGLSLQLSPKRFQSGFQTLRNRLQTGSGKKPLPPRYGIGPNAPVN
jgi:hypothetical protein